MLREAKQHGTQSPNFLCALFEPAFFQSSILVLLVENVALNGHRYNIMTNNYCREEIF